MSNIKSGFWSKNKLEPLEVSQIHFLFVCLFYFSRVLWDVPWCSKETYASDKPLHYHPTVVFYLPCSLCTFVFSFLSCIFSLLSLKCCLDQTERNNIAFRGQTNRGSPLSFRSSRIFVHIHLCVRPGACQVGQGSMHKCPMRALARSITWQALRGARQAVTLSSPQR